MKMNKGERGILSYTRPRYDKEHSKFFPDSDRFAPSRVHIISVTYGGVHTGEPRHCNVCGRLSKKYHVFLDENFKEIYLTDHCLRHPSTALWSEDKTDAEIRQWYSTQYLEGD